MQNNKVYSGVNSQPFFFFFWSFEAIFITTSSRIFQTLKETTLKKKPLPENIISKTRFKLRLQLYNHCILYITGHL